MISNKHLSSTVNISSYDIISTVFCKILSHPPIDVEELALMISEDVR